MGSYDNLEEWMAKSMGPYLGAPSDTERDTVRSELATLFDNIEGTVPRVLPRNDDGITQTDALLETVWDLAAATRTEYCRKLYSLESELIAMGALPYIFGDAQYWYAGTPGNYTLDRVDEATVAAGIVAQQANHHMLMIDIEQWSAATEPEEMIHNTVRAASAWHEGSDRDVGVYLNIPTPAYHNPNNYKNAVDAGQTANAAAYLGYINDDLAQDLEFEDILGPHVDYYCPSLYLHDHGADQTAWKIAAGYMILAAQRIAKGKPIRPIVWHNAKVYTDGVPADEYTSITEAQYIAALQYVASFPGVDGILIWDQEPETTTADPSWDRHAVIQELINGTGDFAGTGLEVYDPRSAIAGASVDRIAPDWWWSARTGLADLADGGTVSTWSSRTPGAVLAATPIVGGNSPVLDEDGMLAKRGIVFTADPMEATLASAHSVSRLTVQALFAWDGADAGDIFAHGDSGTSERAWYIAVAVDGSVKVSLSTDGSALAKIYTSAAGVLTADTPALVGFTFNAGTLAVQVNGTEITMTKGTDNACATLHDASSNVTLCGSLISGATAEPTSGTASDFVIFNRVLTANELLQLNFALRS